MQGLDARSRRSLLLSYVDSTVLRDVMERHNIRNPLALQWLVRQLLAHAGGAFSVNKLHQAMRSQGLATLGFPRFCGQLLRKPTH